MLWVKAGHVVSVIAWMAALLYLPRLMVYHCGATAGSAQAETFKVMERRLLKAIANPAMIATWVFGLWLAIELAPWSERWFQVKLVFVAALTVYHHLAARWVRAFAEDRNVRSQRFYRIANEAPVVMMVVIVVMVIVRPF